MWHNHSIHSYDYLWYLILRGKQKKRKNKQNTKFLSNFNGRKSYTIIRMNKFENGQICSTVKQVEQS